MTTTWKLKGILIVLVTLLCSITHASQENTKGTGLKAGSGRFLSTNYTLSLYNNRNSTAGYVFASYNGNSGVICANDLRITTADVICRQLGYIAAFTGKYPTAAINARPTLISSIICNGYESRIDDCYISQWSGTCQASRISGVSCYAGQKTPDLGFWNNPSYCTFEYGYCGWTRTGSPDWVWHPGNDSSHYWPSFSHTPYVYMVRPVNVKAAVNSALVSPYLLRQTSSSMYVSFSYDQSEFIHEKLTIAVKWSLLSHTIYTKSFGSGDGGGWIFVKSARLTPTGAFKVIITMKSDYAYQTTIFKSVLVIKQLVVHNAKATNLRPTVTVPLAVHISIPGIVIGCIVGAAALILLGFYIYKRQQRQPRVNATYNTSPGYPQPTRLVEQPQTQITTKSQGIPGNVPPSYTPSPVPQQSVATNQQVYPIQQQQQLHPVN